jgi:hypothetical protein
MSGGGVQLIVLAILVFGADGDVRRENLDHDFVSFKIIAHELAVKHRAVMHHKSAGGAQLIDYPEPEILGRSYDLSGRATLVVIISGVVHHAPAEKSLI